MPKNLMLIALLVAGILLVFSCGTGDDDDDHADDDADADDDAGDDDDTEDDPGDPIEPTDGYLERRDQYLQECAEANAPPDGGLHGQLCRLAADLEIDPDPILESLDKMRERRDCADFNLTTLMRILYLYGEHPRLPGDLRDAMVEEVLNFKYWMDEPNIDQMCFWSENHQVLFHTNELLAGNLYPDAVFANSGMTGAEHVAKAARLVRQWIRWRARFGFSEWHSNVYYVEDIPAIVNLADFAPFEDIRIGAAMLLDILAMDLSLNSHQGVFGTSHGRTYPEKVKGGREESTRTISWLWHGKGGVLTRSDFAACNIATSPSYVPPPTIEAIGQDVQDLPFINKDRAGIKVADAPDYGFTYEDYDSITFFWGMSSYAVWQVVEGSLQMAHDYGMFENNGFLWNQVPFLDLLVGSGWAGLLTNLFDPIARGPALEQVHTYAYRTADYQLACAQDNNKGLWAGQQHFWQATLDVDAVVFTTYPGGMDDYLATEWTGGWIPRAGQFENVIVLLYDRAEIPLADFLFVNYTHAYFPRSAFDQWTQEGNWTLGKKGSAYVALYSANPTVWAEDVDYDLVADGRSNVWICELGDQETWGSFENFADAVASSPVSVDGLSVSYESPSIGAVSFGWDGPMTVNGTPADLGPYMRFDNPYIQHPFDTLVYTVDRGGSRLELDFASPRRRYWEQAPTE